MQDMTSEDLELHLEKITLASLDDMDELLKDMLSIAWPTKTSQDS